MTLALAMASSRAVGGKRLEPLAAVLPGDDLLAFRRPGGQPVRRSVTLGAKDPAGIAPGSPACCFSHSTSSKQTSLFFFSPTFPSEKLSGDRGGLQRRAASHRLWSGLVVWLGAKGVVLPDAPAWDRGGDRSP